MDLFPSQQVVFDAAMSGENVFVTGHAGSGKTQVVSEIVDATQQPARGGVVLDTRDVRWRRTHHRVDGKWTLGYADAQRMRDATLLVVNCEIPPAQGLAYTREYGIAAKGHETTEPNLVDGVLREARNQDSPFGGLQVLFHYPCEYDMDVVARKLSHSGLPGRILTIDDRMGG